MSKRIEISAVCPKCDKKYSANVYRTIWGENPSNRKLVFDNLINDVECPDCSHIVKIPIPFLYVDVEKQFAVWYEPGYDSQIDRDIESYNKMFNPGNFYATAPRISDWNEFKKTIVKFENGELNAKPITQLKGLNSINKNKSGCLSIFAFAIITLFGGLYFIF